jgi:drug/metabolite transporter (DMT)-like permease
MPYTQEVDPIVKRRWNIPIWAGFAIVIFALVSYIPIFAVFPVTRDVPWANYLLFLAGAGLLAVGLKRAFQNPDRYRGKISGSILAVLSVLSFGFFVTGVVYLTKQIPSAERALRPGQQAPPFVLQDTGGKPVASAELLKGHRAVVLVFYRGY